jgi:hypothetical protein
VAEFRIAGTLTSEARCSVCHVLHTRSVHIAARVPAELAAEFQAAARVERRTSSEAIRETMTAYVAVTRQEAADRDTDPAGPDAP